MIFLNPCWQRGPPLPSISASSFFESAPPRYSASDRPEEACLQFTRVVNAQGWRRRGQGRLFCIKGRALQADSISADFGARARVAGSSRGSLAFPFLPALPNLSSQYEGAQPGARLLRGGVLPVGTQPGHRAGPWQEPGRRGAAEPA